MKGGLYKAGPSFVCKKAVKLQSIEENNDDRLGNRRGVSLGNVDRFCYLPILIGERIFIKIRRYSIHQLCEKLCLSHGNETETEPMKMERKVRAEASVFRWICGLVLKEIFKNTQRSANCWNWNTSVVTKKGRLRWFTHVERTDDADWTTLCDHG